MAKNNTMAAKHAKAKKEAIKQKTVNLQNTICATQCNPLSKSVIWSANHKPYSV